MITYINTTELYQVYQVYSTIYNLDLVDTFSQNNIPISRLESWNQLFESSQTDLLFSSLEKPILIFDIRELSLTKNVLSSISGDDVFYVYSSQNKLLAQDKKLLNQHGGSIIEPNILSKHDLESFAFEYASRNQYNLSKHNISTLLQLTTNLLEIIDIIDYIFLSDNPDICLLSLIKKETIPIFMLPVRGDKIKEDLKRWLAYINKDDIQIILSMLFTKLEKHNSAVSVSLIKKLIRIDNMIKSQSRLDSSLLVRLFIWEAINQTE
jgi:hypothetical protein